jgi:hypothetical protein
MAKLASITREQLQVMNPYNANERLKLFGRRKSMNIQQALKAGVSIGDILWVAVRMGRKRQCVQFALACAQRTAHLNTDPRVQAAIDAGNKWVQLDAAGDARDAARDAARAAAGAAARAARAAAGDARDAAGAAAGAAWTAAGAARDAARAAAGAARDAARAAWTAAAGDARDAELEEQKKILLNIFGG